MTRLILSGAIGAAATVLLAFLYHQLSLGVFFPFGGGEFHWVFAGIYTDPVQIVSSVRYVILSYSLIAITLMLTLLARSAWLTVAAPLSVVAIGSVFTRTIVGSPSAWTESVLIAVSFAGALVACAFLLRWARRRFPVFTLPVVAGLPGTWYIWGFYYFPFRNSDVLRGTVMPVAVIFPLAFAGCAYLMWRNAAEQVAAPDGGHDN